ncbi:glycoside hydrolase family 5 protein [Inhella sp.]|uniref:glycoside hydrolase family 5 protein n=1 Tax=Inhella sp. TaxID=1921806 RepID=UPI0035B21376
MHELLAALVFTLAPLTALAQGSQAAHEMARAIGQGVNFGNIFDAPQEGAWGLRLTDDYFERVGDGTPIRSVRLPVRWSNHASTDSAARIDPAFITRITGVVDRLLARGVVVILNLHHYRQLDGDPLDPGETRVDDAVVEQRFLSIWRQVAQHFAQRSPRLLFEVYNEPHGRLTARWNDLLREALGVIRASNPTRLVVIGPTHWNAATALPELQLPPDPHLILTVHHYEPFEFTHQGAEWVEPRKPTGLDCCDATQRAHMARMLDLAVQDQVRRGYPFFVGEWGAYSKAPPAARQRYTRTMRELMKERGLPWLYWEFAAGFGFYDPERRQWREPLYRALFGPDTAQPR